MSEVTLLKEPHGPQLASRGWVVGAGADEKPPAPSWTEVLQGTTGEVSAQSSGLVGPRQQCRDQD